MNTNQANNYFKTKIKNNNHFVLFLVLSILISNFLSCSSLLSGRMKIVSIPAEASVYQVDGEGKITLLGKTPLELNEQSLNFQLKKYVQLEISKNGFQSKSMIITKGAEFANYEISVKLNFQESELSGVLANKSNEKLAKGIADSRNLIQLKRYDEAEKILIPLSQEFSHVSVILDYLGNIAYLKRDYQTAYKYYEKSVSLNPGNVNSVMMLNNLKNIVGVSKSTSSG